MPATAMPSEENTIALLIATPTFNTLEWGRFGQFEVNIPTFCPMPATAQRYGSTVWQIPLDTGLAFFIELLRLAATSGVPVRVLFFRKSPHWIEYPRTAQ